VTKRGSHGKLSGMSAESRLLPPELTARVEALAARSTLSAADILAQALREGRSLDWQERFVDQVERGLAAADRGDFASEADVERVLGKHRR
jgi:predicted transcriptional regulator